MPPVQKALDLVLLVDFGNTLVDETFLWRGDEQFPDWVEHWSAVMASLGPAWDRGQATTGQVLAEMARRTASTPERVQSHFDRLCGDIRRYGAITGALGQRRAAGGRQALVTVNPDCFGAIAERCGVLPLFDLVVTSAELGTSDKAAMCEAACDRFGVSVEKTALVDNLEANVDSWRARGGCGYRFVDDLQFARDLTDGLIPGFDARWMERMGPRP